jgi:glucokinase
MRLINRSAVVEYLRLVKHASRTQISRQLKISKPTVMRIINQLINDGFVLSIGKDQSGKGRHQELLALDKNNNLVIGVDIGGSHIGAAVINIGGVILHSIFREVTWGESEENLIQIKSIIEEILESAKKENGKLLGIAIGVPGIVESETGIIRLAPSMNWVDFPLLEKLRKTFEIPISIENDVNLAVLGEHWYGSGIGVENLVMVAIGTGIGAGLILNGSLYRGHQESSGEVGYILPSIKFLYNKYPGFGALESVASGKGIVDIAKAYMNGLNPNQTSQQIEAEDIFEAARTGEKWASEITSQTSEYLGLAITNIAACFDPEVIIIGGGISNAFDLLIEPVKERIAGVIPNMPRIICSQLKEKAVLLGSVVSIVKKVMQYSVIIEG